MLLLISDLITDLPINALRNNKTFERGALVLGERFVGSDPFAERIRGLDEIIKIVSVEVFFQPLENALKLLVTFL